MNSPRYSPAGLLIEHGQVRVAIDGGPGAEPAGPLAAWLVTDERAELIREPRRLAAAHGLRPAVRAYRADRLVITPLPVVHTSHPAYGYLIGASGTRTAWAPEFLFPSWAAGADLMFAEAAGWARPIRFAKGAGGHAPALEVAEQAARHGVLRLVFAHKRTPTAGPFTVHPQQQVQAHHLHGHPLRARFPQTGAKNRRPAQPSGTSGSRQGPSAVVSLYVSAGRERELDRTNCPGDRARGGMAEKPAAKKLAGDPQDLIRAMPAEGDRPAGPFLPGVSRSSGTARRPVRPAPGRCRS
jgi:hypothetical protein